MSSVGRSTASAGTCQGVYIPAELLGLFSVTQVNCQEFQPDVSMVHSAVGLGVTGS